MSDGVPIAIGIRDTLATLDHKRMVISRISALRESLASEQLMLGLNTANAQLSPYKFNQLFDQAFQNVMVANYAEAIPVLNTLIKSDAEHAQVQFLLAMCSMKQGRVTERELQLLESAVKRYDPLHQSGRVESRTAPAKAWFFLAEACAQLKQHSKAVNAYRNYMTCIPLASIEHKKKIMDLIADNRAAASEQFVFGSPSLLATRKP